MEAYDPIFLTNPIEKQSVKRLNLTLTSTPRKHSQWVNPSVVCYGNAACEISSGLLLSREFMIGSQFSAGSKYHVGRLDPSPSGASETLVQPQSNSPKIMIERNNVALEYDDILLALSMVVGYKAVSIYWP